MYPVGTGAPAGWKLTVTGTAATVACAAATAADPPGVAATAAVVAMAAAATKRLDAISERSCISRHLRMRHERLLLRALHGLRQPCAAVGRRGSWSWKRPPTRSAPYLCPKHRPLPRMSAP